MELSGWLSIPTLKGHHLRLEPLHERHAESLARSATDATLTFLLSIGGAATANTDEEWRGFISRLNARPGRVNWGVVMTAGPAQGEVAGLISYREMSQADRWLEIGTLLTPPFQGGPANPEAKLLVLKRAFEVLEANRVQFKVDAQNAQSCAALRKLGVVEEGTLRAYQLRPDGTPQDSVMFSVIRPEWPGLRQRLRERLGRF